MAFGEARKPRRRAAVYQLVHRAFCQMTLEGRAGKHRRQEANKGHRCHGSFPSKVCAASSWFSIGSAGAFSYARTAAPSSGLRYVSRRPTTPISA